MFRDARERRLRAARARHPSAESFISWSPSRWLRRLLLDRPVSEMFQPFFLLVLTGLALNYAYYESFSLYYLFIGGIQDWFVAFQTLLDYGVGQGNRYNGFYVIVNGIYYFFLVRAGINLADSVIRSSRPFRNSAVLIGVIALLFAVDATLSRLML